MGQLAVGGVFAVIEEFVGSRTELFVAIVVIVGTVGAAAIVYRWLRQSNGERFRGLLADQEAVAVLLHPNPDPDAMASATAIAALAAQVDTEVTIQYPGQIRHQENRAFRTVLDLELDNIEHVTDLAAESVVLVDHNSPRGFTGAEGILPLAVIDHHPGEGTGELFTDVRTDYGACASIVAEYFEDIGAVPVPADQHASETGAKYVLPSAAATGLLYGILSDTKDLTVGASAVDFEAASYLHPGVDGDKLDRIANPEVDAEVLEIKARAIAGRRIEGSFAVSDVGTVSNADAIPQAADEIIRLEGVTAVVIAGEKDGTIHLSGRSRDDRVHMGQVLESVTDGISNASAGGHARMGGGQIAPQPQLSDGGEPIGTDTVPREALIDRLFASMSGEI
ncbi:DHH family phosphoesterase [Halohasta salina]|uniref:DHH family phosphoesterase n=1 Tax=Halohasta salina TaxID=2961621 RepID=UPI0020A3A946|nr:DHHA1 domain-containing protein [Halohasta salina]